MTPARKAPRTGSRAFAATWWGQAWVDALEASTLDVGRLSRGRTYARKGMVGPVTAAPGVLRAEVEGSAPWPYDAAVHLRVLTDAQWNTLLDAIAAQAGRTAALLDGEMPADLVDDARAAGVPLLPEPDELDPECSCPDWGYPCKHAAALCYSTAAHLDDDPFWLFTLRGRTKEAVLGALRTRRQARTNTAPQTADMPPGQGVPARDAFASFSDVFTPPATETAEGAPGEPEAAPHPLTTAPPPGAPFTLDDLEALTHDTAQRARRLAAGHTASLTCTPLEDAVRLAATGISEDWFHQLTRATGLPPLDFARLVRALRHGGPAGVAVARGPLTPDPAAMAAARTALADPDNADDTVGTVRLRAWRNRLTADDEGVQIRLGPDNRWHPYTQEDRGAEWWPCAPATADPVAALLAARTATAPR
ncbi:SWIM zinc finger family protein [Streptomyces himalayensis]|uniref:SWIM zinc finger family protein n=1 Tax=Streptomyces himalayensis subsp. himalayensis TaxID=2756131 RepID=A0A7W0DJ04_9ACTN|nr:SWIM zinc finger family protein [Streptomyces himalayensis]MBA2945660.1 SWIM zinc finger family protein [Streptomyces himalayensis subsp. himalayensis]